MRTLFFLLFILPFLFSCSSENSMDLEFEREINKRIVILEDSYKFNIITANLQGKKFATIKTQIGNLLTAGTEEDMNDSFDTIAKLFLEYSVTINRKTSDRAGILFSLLIGLDELIFKYVPSRLNFFNYKPIVVPNSFDLKTGDTLKAKIYLTVSDSLYEPEFRLGEYNLPSENGVGEYNMLVNGRGNKKAEGIVIYSNEMGSKDSLNWKYEFEVK